MSYLDAHGEDELPVVRHDKIRAALIFGPVAEVGDSHEVVVQVCSQHHLYRQLAEAAPTLILYHCTTARSRIQYIYSHWRVSNQPRFFFFFFFLLHLA